MAQILPPEVVDMIADRFRVLADPARLRILNVLMQGEHTVSEIVELTELNQANVSKHLRVLRASDFVLRRKEGIYAFYAMADSSVEVLCSVMCGRLEEQAEERSALLGVSN